MPFIIPLLRGSQTSFAEMMAKNIPGRANHAFPLDSIFYSKCWEFGGKRAAPGPGNRWATGEKKAKQDLAIENPELAP